MIRRGCFFRSSAEPKPARAAAFGYILGSVALCLLAVWGGWLLGRV